MTLTELRIMRHVTQEEMAARLDTTQSSVSRLESSSNLNLSSLRKYVEALGGTIMFVAKFKDQRYDIGL